MKNRKKSTNNCHAHIAAGEIIIITILQPSEKKSDKKNTYCGGKNIDIFFSASLLFFSIWEERTNERKQIHIVNPFVKRDVFNADALMPPANNIGFPATSDMVSTTVSVQTSCPSSPAHSNLYNSINSEDDDDICPIHFTDIHRCKLEDTFSRKQKPDDIQLQIIAMECNLLYKDVRVRETILIPNVYT